jgi:hypothetical protein
MKEGRKELMLTLATDSADEPEDYQAPKRNTQMVVDNNYRRVDWLAPFRAVVAVMSRGDAEVKNLNWSVDVSFLISYTHFTLLSALFLHFFTSTLSFNCTLLFITSIVQLSRHGDER